MIKCLLILQGRSADMPADLQFLLFVNNSLNESGLSINISFRHA